MVDVTSGGLSLPRRFAKSDAKVSTHHRTTNMNTRITIQYQWCRTGLLVPYLLRVVDMARLQHLSPSCPAFPELQLWLEQEHSSAKAPAAQGEESVLKFTPREQDIFLTNRQIRRSIPRAAPFGQEYDYFNLKLDNFSLNSSCTHFRKLFCD